MTWRRTMGTLVAMAALVAGCAGGGMQGDKMAMEKKSLYDRLGGKPALTEAGADLLETNTFNSTRVSQSDYRLEHLVRAAFFVSDDLGIHSQSVVIDIDG